jgi:tetratricopeptide (TPR) repeat protein
LGGVAVLVLAGGGYLAYHQYLGSVAQNAGEPPTRDIRPQSMVGEPRRRAEGSKLKRLLSKAEAYWEEGRLLEPDSDNAFEIYRQILALDPDNQMATKRLVEIGRKALAREKLLSATRLVGDGAFAEAEQQVSLGLRVDPDNVQLLALRETIRGELGGGTVGRKPMDQVSDLLRTASEQWAAGRLVDPLGDNAFETYRHVLDLDPANALAKKKLVEIGRINAIDKVYESARQLQRKGNLSDALEMIEAGLKMSPQNQRLLELQEDLRAKR